MDLEEASMPNNRLTTNHALKWLCVITVILVSLSVDSIAQTTGKISGRVTDAQTGAPMVGANIILEGTNTGAAADMKGEYFIINVPPGTYRLRTSSVGYESVVMKDIVVSVNRTTTADFKLKESVVSGQEVVIVAEPIQQKKDQTSSIRNVTSEQISALPVENLDQVVALQAGVVRGHFRGGRDKEVAYLINGVQVQEPYNLDRAVTVENDVISEVEIITGTFNAEYGNAMSGVVNAITKDGSNTFQGSAYASGSNFATSHTGVFPDIKTSGIANLPGSQDYKLLLQGPIVENLLTFIVNGRYQNNVGPRNGIRRFMPDNYSDWSSQDSAQWRSDHTGDNAAVAMETSEYTTAFGKISFKPLQTLRSSIEYSYNDSRGDNGSSGLGTYNHFYKYNPDGRKNDYGTSQLLTGTLNHTLTPSVFYELKATYLKDWNASYVFKNPFEITKNSSGGDSLNVIGLPVYRYVSDEYGLQGSANPGFSTGGQDKGWSENWNEDYKVKFDATAQLNKHHTFKGGVDITDHTIHRFNTQIQNAYQGTSMENLFYDDSASGKRVFLFYKPEVVLGRSQYTDIYKVNPWEGSAYLQDKMEFDLMVVNLGVRYDYFDANTTYPSDPRNPGNDVINSPLSTYLKAPVVYQFSPRFGISYKLGDAALLRFSYGHFFQMPPLYALYVNFQHVVPPGDYQTLMGNPLVKPQRTIQYESGLWQQLGPNMSAEVAVFYRDIYDLLGTRIVETYNAVKYGLYTNLDYGNARGLELKYDYYSGNYSAGLNYTLQYTRGNANSPQYTFNRAGQQQDPVNILIPMDWDQRHTLNATVAYNSEKYGGSITGRFDSGLPYGWTPLTSSFQALATLQPNNSEMPSLFSVDFDAYVDLWSIGSTRARLTLLVYNLLDKLNETAVNTTTGRADQQIILPTDIASYRSNFSTIYDRIDDPSSYSNPRSIKLGIEFIF